jgi:hypothetical protein
MSESEAEVIDGGGHLLQRGSKARQGAIPCNDPSQCRDEGQSPGSFAGVKDYS